MDRRFWEGKNGLIPYFADAAGRFGGHVGEEVDKDLEIFISSIEWL